MYNLWPWGTFAGRPRTFTPIRDLGTLSLSVLLRFTPESSRFTEIDSLLIPDLISGSFSLVLDTAVGVFLWLPAVYWEREGRNKMALEITDVRHPFFAVSLDPSSLPPFS